MSNLRVAIYSRTNETAFSSTPHIVIYLFDAFSSLGQLLAATVVHMHQPDKGSLLYIAGGTTLAATVIFCSVLAFLPLPPATALTASKCQVTLAGIGVFSSVALTSFALRNIPHLHPDFDQSIDETSGRHRVGLFHITFTLSRFVAVFLSLRVSSCSFWFYSALLTVLSILLLNFKAQCNTSVAVLVFGSFAGPLHPSSLSSLTNSGPVSPLNVILLVLATQLAECIRLLKTDAIHIVLMVLAVLCLASGVLKRLGTTCTWRPDVIVKMIP
ncbi:hypothetical protein BIW11_10183 [Tropilaelaps mercedesae]|uniref:Uncharacterized protein n=1 Tax=Tropilaelaps mercedesae TaxID=418985 RepID=A0A1V9XH46_9ACAR|nr:hypothetical protein BIW11_10183 [Tropilaelaps mercedesae]